MLTLCYYTEALGNPSLSALPLPRLTPEGTPVGARSGAAGGTVVGISLHKGAEDRCRFPVLTEHHFDLICFLSAGEPA